ncbi:hypothetical protein OHS18_30590 [Amycolatopsis sp. NBC_00355]|uniref:hypothetical protein n=1 Tax=Amycolatopsis sp. NBC_00355 TaxID=2975957 RepID=UPI002E25B0AD
MSVPEGDRFVVSRTAGRHWVFAVVLLLVASGFLWMALASTQQSPRLAGFVFGGAFGLLGLNLVRRSLKKPVVNELVIDSTGISRVIGGVAWAVRWDELRAASVVTRNNDQVVLSPAVDRFEDLHRSLVRISDGDYLVAGIELDDRETPRVRDALAKYVKVNAERVTDDRPVRQGRTVAAPRSPMPSGAVLATAVTIHVNGWNRAGLRLIQFFALMIELGLGVAIEFGPRNGFRSACQVVFIAVFVGAVWLEIFEQRSRSRKFRITLELSAAGLHWRSYYRQIVVSWPEIAELRAPSGLVEFRPADDDFPLDRPELGHLRQGDGWYRLPCALSATAAKEFEARIRGVLPASVRLAERAGVRQ